MLFFVGFDSIAAEIDTLSFEIDIPDAIIDAISITEITTILKNHPSMELV